MARLARAAPIPEYAMPVNGFNVGRDVSVDINTSTGPLNFGLITKFTAKQDITDKKVKGLDGITRHARFPDGWSGTFDVERQGPELDNFFAQAEDNYYAGVDEQGGTITETITEVSGAVSQFRFLGVLLKYDDAGDWSGDDTVKQKVSFVASRRVKVS